MQRWRRRHSNTALYSAQAMAADMQLAVSQGTGGRTWCSDLLGALEELERGATTPTLREAAAALQHLPVTDMLALVDAAYRQAQLDASCGGTPGTLTPSTGLRRPTAPGFNPRRVPCWRKPGAALA